MNDRHISGLFGALAALCLAPVSVFGAVAITDPGTAFVNSPGILGTFGYQFTVGPQDLSVAALGLWDSDADGLASSHQIGLWNSSGMLLASLTVPAGALTTRLGEFRYESLSMPLTLGAGETYTLGSAYGASDADRLHTAQAPGPSFSSDIHSTASRYILDEYGFPTESIGGAPYAGPNFTYVVVPEPSGSLLLLVGAAARIRKTKIRRYAATTMLRTSSIGRAVKVANEATRHGIPA